ncbi:hypothetical protein N2152v2_006994 [Parachlorella kessleri]
MASEAPLLGGVLPSSPARVPKFVGVQRSYSSCILAEGASEAKSLEYKSTQRKLILALIFAFLFMIVEVVGGIYAHSLAVITDAAHLLSDVSGFAVSALAAVYAAKRSQEHFSYGYHRVEVLGALASILSVWLVTGVLLFEAVNRIITPEPVNGKVMFILALTGVAVNILLVVILGHSHDHAHGGHSHSHGGHSHSHGHTHSHGPQTAAGRQQRRPPLQNGVGRVSPLAAVPESPLRERRELAAGEQALLVVSGDGSGSGAMGTPFGAQQQQQGEQLVAGKGGGDAPHHPHLHEGDVEAGHHSSSDEEEGSHQCHGHNHGHDHGHNHSHGQCHDGEAAAAGLAACGAAAAAGGHDRRNINLRGAVTHVIGDLVQSIGVAIAGALIWFHQDDPRWYLADPICTFLFAILVMWTTRAILRDIADVLMERVPRGLSIKTIYEELGKIRGVEEVHDLHVWSLTPGIPLLCAHINMSSEADPSEVLHSITTYCRGMGIEHSTVQLVVNGRECPCVAVPVAAAATVEHQH